MFLINLIIFFRINNLVDFFIKVGFRIFKIILIIV